MKGSPSFELVAMTAEDSEYLYALCDATMRGYVEATWGQWNEAAVRAGLTGVVDRGLASTVLVGGKRMGALVCNDTKDPVVLEQLFIDPAHQRQGLGSAIVLELQRKARAPGKGITLSVLKVNPAKGFYERLGFKVVQVTPTHFELEWRNR